MLFSFLNVWLCVVLISCFCEFVKLLRELLPLTLSFGTDHVPSRESTATAHFCLPLVLVEENATLNYNSWQKTGASLYSISGKRCTTVKRCFEPDLGQKENRNTKEDLQKNTQINPPGFCQANWIIMWKIAFTTSGAVNQYRFSIVPSGAEKHSTYHFPPLRSPPPTRQAIRFP